MLYLRHSSPFSAVLVATQTVWLVASVAFAILTSLADGGAIFSPQMRTGDTGSFSQSKLHPMEATMERQLEAESST